MGFLKSIGQAVGGIARTVSKVADVVGKVTNFLQKPLDQIMAPVKKLVGGALDKLPFGIGNFIKPFAEKFLDKALSFVAGGPLGGLGLLAKAMPTIKKLADLAETVGGIAKKVGDALPPQGGVNLQNIFAHAHAQKLLEA
jgi:hypothetical protein